MYASVIMQIQTGKGSLSNSFACFMCDLACFMFDRQRQEREQSELQNVNVSQLVVVEGLCVIEDQALNETLCWFLLVSGERLLPHIILQRKMKQIAAPPLFTSNSSRWSASSGKNTYVWCSSQRKKYLGLAWLGSQLIALRWLKQSPDSRFLRW